jgi:hypothetical protein
LTMRFMGGWPPIRGSTESASLLSLGRMCSIERPEAVEMTGDGPNALTHYSLWT